MLGTPVRSYVPGESACLLFASVCFLILPAEQPQHDFSYYCGSISAVNALYTILFMKATNSPAIPVGQNPECEVRCRLTKQFFKKAVCGGSYPNISSRKPYAAAAMMSRTNIATPIATMMSFPLAKFFRLTLSVPLNEKMNMRIRPTSGRLNKTS